VKTWHPGTKLVFQNRPLIVEIERGPQMHNALRGKRYAARSFDCSILLGRLQLDCPQRRKMRSTATP
jgi:hypothetical protein